MTRFLRAALLAAAIAIPAAAPSTASAAYYEANYVLLPGQEINLPWVPLDCIVTNSDGSYVYPGHHFLFIDPNDPYYGGYDYKLWYYLTPLDGRYQRAVLDYGAATLESRTTFIVRAHCWWY